MRLAIGIAALVLTAIVLAAGCASRRTPISSTPATPSVGSTYVDLQPEWRIRVIVPILKSGKYIVETSESVTHGTDITLQTGADFLGYETSYYQITHRISGGIGIRFQSAAFTRDGATQAAAVSRHPLFLSTLRFRHVRLLFLKRSSVADHDMAAIAANRSEQISDLTRQINANPASCVISPASSCEWIPRGISVLPEKQQFSENTSRWIPAD